MAKGEDITTKFKVDISDFKKGITEANKQIKLANSEFKAATSGMDNWSKSTDGLEAKLSQLKSVLTQQVSKLKNYKDQLKAIEQAEAENGKRVEEARKAYEKAASQYGSNSDEAKKYAKALNDIEKEQLANKTAADGLRTTILNQQAAINGTVRDLRNYNTQLTDVRAAQSRAESATGKLSNEIEKQKNELDRAKRAYQDAVIQYGKNSDEAKALRNNIKTLSSELRENEEQMQSSVEAADELDLSLDEVEGTSIETSEGFTILKGALADLVAEGIKKAIAAAKEFAQTMITTAAEVKAQNSQFEQAFGDMADEAEAAVARVASSTGILDSRLKTTASNIYAFARSSGATVPEAMSLMETALMASADSAAYYDKSLEDSAETLQSFLKGNYANDAALGVSATEFTRNAKATELFGKKYNDLTEIQKQQTLLKMVTDSQALSGAMGQAAREADGWENVQGNLNETWRQFQAQVGTPFLEALIPVIQKVTTSFKKWSDSVDWDAFGKKVETNLKKIEDGFNWFIKNRSTVVGALKAMVAAYAAAKMLSFSKAVTTIYKAMRTATTVAQANTVAQSANTAAGTLGVAMARTQAATTTLLTGVTRTNTVAQNANTIATNAGAAAARLFNAAWKANPVGIVVTAVAALAAGIIYLTKHVKESTKETDENVIATKKLSEEQKELTKEIQENSNARKEAIEDAKTEGATIQVLSDKLTELANKENKTNAEKEQMKSLVSQLNTLMPELNLQYNEEKDALNMSTEALQKNVAAQKELLKAKAAQEQLTEIASDMAKKELELAEITKQQEANEKALLEAQKERAAFEQIHGDNRWVMNTKEVEQYKQLLQAEENAKAALAETNTQLEDNKQSLAALNEEFNTTSEYSAKLFDESAIQSKLATLTDLCKNAGVDIPKALMEGMEEGRYIVPESIDAMNKLISFDEALKAAGLAGKDIPLSISDGIANGKLSVEQAVDQVQEYVNFDKSFQRALEAGSAIPKNLADGVKSGTITVQEAMDIINSTTKFDEALEAAKTAGTTIPENLASNLREGKISVDDAIAMLNQSADFTAMVEKAGLGGTELTNSLTEGITSGKLTPQQAIDEINALTTYEQLITKAKENGIQLPLSIEQGILEGKTKPSEAIAQMEALISYQDALDKAKLNGASIPTYFSESIADGSLTVTDAVAAMNALVQFQTALEKTGQEGADIPATLAQQIIDGKVSVEDATEQMNNWIKFEAALTEADLSGAKIPENIQQGILNGKLKPKDAIEQLNDDVIEEAKRLNDPLSDAAKKSGQDYTDGLDNGVNDSKKKSTLFTTITDLGKSMLDKLKNAIDSHSPSKETKKIGGYYLDGIYNGIVNRDKRNSIFNSIASFGASLLTKLKNALAEKSPSKATKQMGEYLLEGLGLGIQNEENSVYKQVSEFGKNVVDKLQNQLSAGVSLSGVNSDKIKLAKANLTGLTASVQSGLTGGALSGSVTTNGSNVNNFTQIINAPKQPSRIELYRQTRNLLDLKGGI